MSESLAPRAKEPTPAEAQQRREAMFDLNEQIKVTMNEGRTALWKLAAQLDLWDEQVGWSALGYEKLNDWLADPDVSMSRGRFQDLVGTYRELKQRQIPAETIQTLEHSKVRIALPAVKRGEANIQDVVDDSKTLGAQDLREKYRDQAAVRTATGHESPETEHEGAGGGEENGGDPGEEDPTDFGRQKDTMSTSGTQTDSPPERVWVCPICYQGSPIRVKCIGTVNLEHPEIDPVAYVLDRDFE